MRHFLLLTCMLVLASCAKSPEIREADITSQQMVAPHAVAMPDTFSADAALTVLNNGGNAVDAAIAAQFVLAVTLPEAGNIGGGGFMTLYMDGKADFLDYREMAPGAAHRDMYLDKNGSVKPYDSLFGVRASGIPGTVAGMWAAHQRYGKMPWESLVQPAVTLAEKGFLVPVKLSDNINSYLKRQLKQQRNSNFGDYFAHATGGTLFKQPELAATLKAIRNNGKDGFYAGEVATTIAKFMAAEGGLINEDDLAKYEAKWRTPIRYDWQGYSLVTAPPPSSGGVAVAQWIGMLDAVTGEDPLPPHNSAPYIHLLSEIGKRVFADRAEYLGDPDFVRVPVDKLIDRNYIARRAAGVNTNAISVTDDIKPGLYESEQTTHFSILDKWGNAVANTTTLNLGFGSGVVVEGAGFLLNDEMDDFSAKPGVPNFFGAIGGKANEIQPYKRMLSSMTPTIVLNNNQVTLVTGSPGGTTIISSVAQSVLSALAFDMSAEAAVNSPRFHHQLWPKDTIRIHPGFSEETKAALEDMGYTLSERRFGDLHLIKRTDAGVDAASEKSGRGKSAVFRPVVPAS